MAKEILHKRLCCTESQFGTQGHNKLWYVTVYDDGSLKTEWGRTGGPMAENTKSFGSSDAALREAEKLIAKKKKGKKGKDGKPDSVYTEIEVAGVTGGMTTKPTKGGKVGGRDLQRKAAEEIAAGDKEIEKLVTRFAQENIHNITQNTSMTYDDTTGLFSTPAGVIGQSSIDSARDVLAEIRDLVVANDFDSPKAPKLIDQYLRFVPQDTGRNRPTVELICPDLGGVDKQVSILDSLQASLDMLNDPGRKKGDKDTPQEAKIWDITMKVMRDSDIFHKIKRMYEKTAKAMHACHHLKLKRVYVVDHHGMSAAFKSKGEKVGNVWQLWHGTRVGNILSILSKGMIIPPANASHCTGSMYGRGCYFSDESTKSLNYAYGYWGHGRAHNNCFMFLVDVAMGKYYVPRSYNERFPKPGYDSTFAKGGKSGVHNNEMIVYNTHQAALRYLCEFDK